MNEAALKTILHRVRGTDEGVSDEPDSQDVEQEESQPVTAEGLTVSVLAEHEPDEVTRILAVWQEMFGIKQDRKRIEKHLKTIREWRRRWVK